MIHLINLVKKSEGKKKKKVIITDVIKQQLKESICSFNFLDVITHIGITGTITGKCVIRVAVIYNIMSILTNYLRNFS